MDIKFYKAMMLKADAEEKVFASLFNHFSAYKNKYTSKNTNKKLDLFESFRPFVLAKKNYMIAI